MINIKATADLLGLGDSLNALGISIDDPCDASALVSAIIDETTALIKETEESIALVSAKAGAQNFVATLVAILGDFAAAAVGELVDTFVADMFFGNLIGSLASAFTLLMTAIQGIEIIEEISKFLNTGDIIVLPIITYEVLQKVSNCLRQFNYSTSLNLIQTFKGLSISEGTRFEPNNPVFIIKAKKK